MGEAMSPWREYLRRALGNPWAERGVKFVLVPALLLCSLWLPPVSLGARLFHTDLPQITAQGGVVGEEGGAQLAVAPGALSGQMRLGLRTVALDSAEASKGDAAKAIGAVPANLQLLGSLYFFNAYGSRPQEAVFAAPLPEGLPAAAEGQASLDDLDLYAWDGKAWQWVPSQPVPDAGQIQATLTSIPRALAAVQAQPQGLAIGVGAPDSAAVNAAPLDLASELYLSGLSLADGGAVKGEIALDSAPADLLVLPTLSNRVDGVARTDWVANIVTDSEARAAHVQAIVDAVNQGGYGGLSLAYEGMDASVADDMAAFVDELAAALHKAGKVLAVQVDAPKPAADGTWDTGGYPWVALGQAADILRVPAMSEAAAYGPGGAMEACLQTLTRQVDRRKVQLVLSANSIDQAGGREQPLVYGDALSLASQSPTTPDGATVVAGETLAVQLPQLGSGLHEDANSGQTYFSFTDGSGVEHTVWVENSSSVARKLSLAHQFCLRGVTVDDLAGTANDARIWETVRVARSATGDGESASAQGATSRYSVIWRVLDKDGQEIDQGSSPAEAPTVAWTPKDAGEYTMVLAISEDGKTTLGQESELAINIPTPTPSPTPKPTAQPQAAAPSAPSAPAAPAPSRASTGFFGYGIQVDMVTDGNHGRILDNVQALGFGWIKQQVEWFRYNSAPGQYDWGALDRIVDSASARGIKVLFSVCKAPNWARPGDDDRGVAGPPADPNTLGEFMKQMATRYRGRVGAYEIWNEQNLYYEWGGRGGRLNAGAYVQLLRAAYTAIKGADPSAVVVSGALTPTGYNDGDVAIDDQQYLRQMYDAGLKNYCDAVGAHPSGFNNPPDADWRSYSDPANSFQAVGHPSWFFRGTMEGYRNIMVAYGDGSKRIWPTEFGWASVDGFGTAPAGGYEYASDNTAGEQAQFIVRAYQMGKNWGFVGPMFLWNLNFAPLCGPGDEKAAFGIVDPGWGPRAAFSALASMPK